MAHSRNETDSLALTIGNFDGVHRGHQALASRLTAVARARALVPAALTFDPHPATILAPERAPRMLCTVEERIDRLQAAGLARVIVLPFTRELAAMSPEIFVRQVLIERLRAKAVVVGENFRFGNRQTGDINTLAALGDQLGFTTEFLPPVQWRGEVVSSSAIRNHLAAGSPLRASRLLGRCYALSGPVVSGHGIGAKQTVPTLNLEPGPLLIPKSGVYITETSDLGPPGRSWPSITNVGYRPTFGGTELTIETFLLEGYSGAAPVAIKVVFRRYVRNERQFAEAGALRQQILADVARARRYWRLTERLTATRTIY